MTQYTEQNSFDTVLNLYDITDPVLGGFNGQSNDPIKTLGDRTRFLYNYLQSFSDAVSPATGSSIDATFLRKLVYIVATGNVSFTLASAAGFLNGQTLHFKCKNSLGKSAAIIPATGETISDGTVAKNIWLYDGEAINLTRVSTTEWQITEAKGNFGKVGTDGLLRRQPRNSIIANGTVINRVDYARLWDEIAGDIIPESTWLSDPISYRGFFTGGDGATTFRLPDMRSMSWRGLDLGRGVTYSRNSIYNGGYQADDNKAHTHEEMVYQAVGDGGLKPVGFTHTIGGINGSGVQTGSAGSTEVTVKNIGFTPVIYF